MNFIEKLNYNTLKSSDIKREVSDFIKIVSNYFSLSQHLEDRVEYIYKRTWTEKPNNFHNIRYENIVLGIVLFVQDEYYDSIDIDRMMSPNSVSSFVNEMYKECDVKSNIIQVYRIRDTIKQLHL